MVYNTIVKTTVAEWLEKKHLEWQTQLGERKKAKEFAEHLGIKPTTYSSWVNGGVLPTGDNLKLVAGKLGYEIYDILGVPRPDPIEEVKTALGMLPPERGDELLKLVTDWLTTNGIAGPFAELDE